MGVYDTIILNGREGQVKCWHSDMHTYLEGDPAPYVEEGENNYSIAMREGGWVNVEAGIIESWTNSPTRSVKYNKWGQRMAWTQVYEHTTGVYYERRVDSYTVLD